MTVSEMRQLYAYTEWANDLVLTAAEQVAPEQLVRDVQISHKSILGTLTHMAGAEWIWLERWHGNSIVGTDVWKDWTPERCPDLKQLRAKWQPVIEKRHQYLERLTDAELPLELGYKRFTGESYSLPLVGQLQHVVNHATLHRGQVVGMIRQLGITPPATDLLFYMMAKK